MGVTDRRRFEAIHPGYGVLLAGLLLVTASACSGVGVDDAGQDPPRETEVTVYYLAQPADSPAGDLSGLTLLLATDVLVGSSGDRGLDAVRALLTVPPPERRATGLNFVEPGRGTKARIGVNAVTQAGRVITVDLDSDPWDPYPSIDFCCPPHGAVVMQQIVWTVQTALATDDPVLLTVNGKPARGIWFHRLDGPVAGRTGFDGLSVELELRSGTARSGKGVGGRLRIRNDSDQAVVDPACSLAADRRALIPADQPDTELWLVTVVDCAGPRVLLPGHRSTTSWSRFPARTQYGDPLPPGDYLAALEIDGLPRLSEPVTVVAASAGRP